MFEDRLFRQTELVKAGDSLPELSPGLRSRVLAAALEAQDRRAQGRRVLASALGLFAMLAGVAWLGPVASGPFSDGSFAASNMSSSPGAASAISVEGRGIDAQLVDQKQLAGQNVTGQIVKGKKDATAASTLSSFGRGPGLMSVMGDDWRSVEDELRSRQEHFLRFQM